MNNKSIVQVIDLFSGCGGMSHGFARATTSEIEYKVLGGLDIDKHARDTYERMIGRPALGLDVRSLATESILKSALDIWGYNPNLPLILIGCAPCQGFSSHRKKDQRVDERNELLSAFAGVVIRLRPDLVIMENVPEIFYQDHWHHFEGFRSQLAAEGYDLRARVENLAGFGVPQERYRALVVGAPAGTRITMPPLLRNPLQFSTVRDAIGSLPPLLPGERDPLDPMHQTSRHRPETVHLLSLIPKDGGSRKSLPEGIGLDCHRKVDGFRDVYGRLWWDRPAVAITARCRTPSCGRFVHPEQNRGLSVREAALLQGFPSDFMFEGPFDDKFKQIGNAVSPTFSRALAEHIDRNWATDVSDAPSHDDITSSIKKSISSSLASMKRRLRQLELVPLEKAA